VAQQEAGSLATLVPRYLHAARQHAEPRYQHAAIQALGAHHGRALIEDPAWDAVTQRLSASSTAEVLTWRIDTILKTTTHKPTEANLYRVGAALPPWMPPPPSAADRTPLARYMTEAAALISARISDLAETAVRDRPSWMTALGQPPATLYQRQQWLRHVAIVAAYRDQHKITTTDPAQPLGPTSRQAVRITPPTSTRPGRSTPHANSPAPEPGNGRERHRPPARTTALTARQAGPSYGSPVPATSPRGLPGPALLRPSRDTLPALPCCRPLVGTLTMKITRYVLNGYD
jgi:hypothetical protein